MKNTVYYQGFEGEPEIQIILKRSEEDYVLSIWEGYFDRIMMLIPPSETGWTGIAYNYQMCNAWDDEPMWVVEDIVDAYDKFKSISKMNLDSKSISVLNKICDLFLEAILNNYIVIINRE